MEQLFTNYPPSTKKLLKGHCKREGFRPFRFERMLPEERENRLRMIRKVYRYLSKDKTREILLPVNHLSISQDHDQLLFCMTSSNGKEIPVQIDTQIDTESYLFKSEENIEYLHKGGVCYDIERERYTSSYKDSQTGEYKYFAFKDISSELE